MVKNQFVLGIAVLALVISPLTVLAQTLVATSTGRPVKEIREEPRDQIRETRENRIEEKREEKKFRGEERERKINIHAEKIVSRLTAALERSARFIERIESVLKNREDNGQPIGNAEVIKIKLNETKNMIPAVQNSVNALPNKIRDIMANSTSTVRYSDIRNVVTESTRAVKNIHAKVIEAVRLIKATPNIPPATTTPVSN